MHTRNMIVVGVLIAMAGITMANAMTKTKTKTKTPTPVAHMAATLPLVASGNMIMAVGANSRLFNVFCNGTSLPIVDASTRSPFSYDVIVTDGANMYWGNARNGTTWLAWQAAPAGVTFTRIVYLSASSPAVYVSGWSNNMWYLWSWNSTAFQKVLCNGCGDGTEEFPLSDSFANPTAEKMYQTAMHAGNGAGLHFFFSNSTGFYYHIIGTPTTNMISTDSVIELLNPQNANLYAVTQSKVDNSTKVWVITPGTPMPNIMLLLDGSNTTTWPSSLAGWQAPLTIKNLAGDQSNNYTYVFASAKDSSGTPVHSILQYDSMANRTIVLLACNNATSCSVPSVVFSDAGQLDTVAASAWGIGLYNIAYIFQNSTDVWARSISNYGTRVNLIASAKLSSPLPWIAFADTDIAGPVCPAPMAPGGMTRTPTAMMPSSPSPMMPSGPSPMMPPGPGPMMPPGAPGAGPMGPPMGAPGMMAPPTAAQGNCTMETMNCIRKYLTAPIYSGYNYSQLMAPFPTCNYTLAPIYNCMRQTNWASACMGVYCGMKNLTDPFGMMLINSMRCSDYGCNNTLPLPQAPAPAKENIGLWIGIGAAVLVGAVALGGLVVWQMKKKAALAQKALQDSFQQQPGNYDTEYGGDTQYTQQNEYTDNQSYNEGDDDYDDYNNDGDGYDEYGYDQTQTQN